MWVIRLYIVKSISYMLIKSCCLVTYSWYFKNHGNKIAMGIVKFRDQLVAPESHEADNTAVDATNSTLDLESDL